VGVVGLPHFGGAFAVDKNKLNQPVFYLAEFRQDGKLTAKMRTITKHTSTDLEEVDVRIRQALKNLDISEVTDISLPQDLSPHGLRRFAENGMSECSMFQCTQEPHL
jgi:hypothetical protein